MRCRHTVPDWHRFVAAGEGALPIFAACRLLTKEGDRVGDPRSIACSYWGHQEDCPLYDGPGKRLVGRPDLPPTLASADEPAPAEDVWPVRSPGAPDGPRVLLLALSTLSVALLTWAAVLGLTAQGGTWMPESFRIVATTGVAVSIVTHILALLRIWARR
jgi:hypothetical protein